MGGSLRNPAAWNNVVGFRTTPRVVPSVGVGNRWLTLSMDGPMGRTVADVALLLGVLGASDGRDPLHRSIELPAELTPPGRPPRVAWSRDLGAVAIEPSQVAVLERFREVVEGLGWPVEDAEPDLRGADECFRTLRAWQISSGPAGQLGDRLSEVKATVQDEVRRGRALGGQDIADAYAHLGALWRRAAEFFSRYDLLVAPVTQLAPFPAEWEYPTTVAGVEMASYIGWMAACCRVTVLGTPTMSLPAGFDDTGLPVGAQLIGRHGGDVDLLRAALALETATNHHSRRPPVVGRGS